MANYDGELSRELAELLGDGLRSVASYDDGGYTMHQIRDDIDADYSQEQITRAYKQIEIEGMGYEHFEQFFQTGRLECAIYGFEKARMFHFPTDVFTGLFVSVDRDRDMDIETIIDVCKEAIERKAGE